MNATLVVDASAALDAVRGAEHMGEVVDVLLAPETALHAPALVDAEVLSATRRLELAGDVQPEVADQLLADFADFALHRHELPQFRTAVWSVRQWCQIADAYYVALARVLDATLVTTDYKLGRTLRERRAVAVLTPGE